MYPLRVRITFNRHRMYKRVQRIQPQVYLFLQVLLSNGEHAIILGEPKVSCYFAFVSTCNVDHVSGLVVHFVIIYKCFNLHVLIS